jgi:four helix bundle protein
MLDRVERYADRVVDVAEELDHQRRFRRIVEQVAGSGSGTGANFFEADQAMSPKDFTKALGIVLKELNETKFWLRIVSRRGWIRPTRLQPLLCETDERLCVLNAMVLRTRSNAARTTPATTRSKKR